MLARKLFLVAASALLVACSAIQPDGVLKNVLEGDVTASNPPKLPAETTQVRAPPRSSGLVRMKIEF